MEKGPWLYHLAPQYALRAQLTFAELLISDAGECNSIKGAILAWYNSNKKAYRNRFWTVMRKEGELNHKFSVHLMDLVKIMDEGQEND